MTTKILSAFYLFMAFCCWLGCANSSLPKDALVWGEKTSAERQLQIRFYDTTKEYDLLISCVQLLQDMGYELEEAEEDLGLIVGGKTRDATDTGQEVARAFYVIMTGASYATDDKQRIRASIVVSPAGENRSKVRVTFQRMIWNEIGQVTKLEQLKDPEIYQRFFSELDKSIFLTGQMQ